LQSYEGVLRIFPNWNFKKNASFKNLRAYGAFLVSSDVKNGNIQVVKIYSEKGRPCTIENPWPGKRVQLIRNGKKEETSEGDRMFFKTNENELIELRPVS
jgi:hypothetical protein